MASNGARFVGFQTRQLHILGTFRKLEPKDGFVFIAEAEEENLWRDLLPHSWHNQDPARPDSRQMLRLLPPPWTPMPWLSKFGRNSSGIYFRRSRQPLRKKWATPLRHSQ